METNTNKDKKVLTDIEKLFLEFMKDPANKGNIRNCMELAGYDKAHRIGLIITRLGPELRDIANQLIDAHSVQASLALSGILVSPETLGAQHTIKAAESILDRAGVSKKTEGGSVDLKIPQGGLFILPAKEVKVEDTDLDA